MPPTPDATEPERDTVGWLIDQLVALGPDARSYAIRAEGGFARLGPPEVVTADDGTPWVCL